MASTNAAHTLQRNLAQEAPSQSDSAHETRIASLKPSGKPENLFSPENLSAVRHAAHRYINCTPEFASGALTNEHANEFARRIGLPSGEFSIQDHRSTGGWSFLSPLSAGSQRSISFRLCSRKPDGEIGRSVLAVESGGESTRLTVLPPNFGAR
ncbi:MAG: hypothetical protein IT290_06345 [Deltaproteobacteria bacterium]|nr:hypothetical protein [Deltaproteobacteria bacterium]